MTTTSELKAADWKTLFYWILERENIRKNKEAGKPKPWTKDPILQAYRFCNVHREDDKVTRWFKDNWREPYRKHKDLGFAFCIGRIFNYPDTLEELGFPAPWDETHARSVIEDRKARGLLVLNGAYVISTNGNSIPKFEYLLRCVMTPAWGKRELARPLKDDTLATYHRRLMKLTGFASFMAAQVVADMKFVDPLCQAEDWWTFAASGPGSRRGLNRLLKRDFRDHWNERAWHATLLSVQGRIEKELGLTISAQDTQNCLCEYDKYVRALSGDGRPKQNYPGRL
jgi:hypothetical protein